ncbi:MAG TPA: acyl-CoA dehydrogenase family protein, partial [Gemmataceae bacterium]|nr:acyl-CoA dehydrogenase family protein [Gemmataceae bacterium]
MDFAIPAELEELRRRVRQFIDAECIPREHLESDEDGLPADVLAELHRRAKEAGLWAPHLPP